MVGVIHLFHQVMVLFDAVTQEQHKSRRCDRSHLLGTITDFLLANDRMSIGAALMRLTNVSDRRTLLDIGH